MKKNRKLRFGVVGVIVALLLTGCNAGDKKTTSVEEKTEVTTTVVTSREETPKWIIDIAEEKKTDQIFVVAGIGQTTAYVSMHEKNAEGVNALRRAEIISTVPSGNPHKYWAREAIFARNCLTI